MGKTMSVELVVLGGGPGGYTAAFRAADLGKEVLVVEERTQLGGVCLNEGCIPSKDLLHTVSIIDAVRESRARGIIFGESTIDLGQVRANKDKTVKGLTSGLKGLARKRGVNILQGVGRFTSSTTLEVEQKEKTVEVRFKEAIIAVGSRLMEVPGLSLSVEGTMDSQEALALKEIPKRLLIVGGGVIGLEMACIYGALGSEITVVELTDQLIPAADSDLLAPLQKTMQSLCKAIYLRTKVTKLTPSEGQINVSFEGEAAPDEGIFEKVLLAMGRRPNGDKIGAEKAGIRVDERGFIPVDKYRRTNLPHIFAVGDVTSPPMLAHKAVHEGKIAAEVVSGKTALFAPMGIPAVAYTDPELAWVGLTEKEAKEKKIPYKKGLFPWMANGRSLSEGRKEGFTKTLFDPQSGRLLGAAIVGQHAGELIAEAVLAIEMGADAEDLSLTIHPHPTLSETMGLSAEVVEGTVTDLLPQNSHKKS